MKHAVTRSLVAAAIALGSGSSLALEQGDWIVRLGAAHVNPDASSDTVAGSTLDVGNDTQLGITLGYMYTDNIGIGLLAATPFKHDIELVGTGTVAETKHLPPTLTLQYHFAPKSNVRPYVGAGINYTNFFSEKGKGALAGSSIKLDDSWGLAAEAGVDIDINDRWFVSGQVWYLDIDTKADISGVANNVNVDIDPWVVMIGIGTTF
ncbi:MAG: outer membrane beta-barrel protein [Gammaproteobacteria bacterium]|nr:outer membrane beta-barrel protein [Gammaproteobacteria bacterium]